MKTTLVFITLCLTAAAADEQVSGSVDIWRTDVTFTCPYREEVKWEGIENEKENENIDVVTRKYDKIKKKPIKCNVKDKQDATYHFYVKAKVCDDCYELDVTLVVGVIIGDLLVTGGIVILIYHWAQRKSGSSPAAAVSRPAPRSAPRGPAVPNRDYEALNPRTRENATYAVAGVHKAN